MFWITLLYRRNVEEREEKGRNDFYDFSFLNDYDNDYDYDGVRHRDRRI